MRQGEAWQGSAVTALGGEELIRRRKLAGYSRVEFAPLVGVKPRTLEGWEKQHGLVPENKQKLVELVLSTAKQEISTMNLLSLLAARLAAGEAAAEQLAAVERDHPDWFEKITPPDSFVRATDEGLTEEPSNVSGSPPQGGVSRGRRGSTPKRRIEGDSGV